MSATPPSPGVSVSRFRLKLLIAMAMAIVGVTGTALFFARRAAEAADQAKLQREFQGEMGWEMGSREARQTAMAERCRTLARSVRILAALEEGEIGDLYRNASVELRDVLRRPDSDSPADTLLHAEFFRFLDPEGKILAPGADSPGDSWWLDQLRLAGLPEQQQTGYVVRDGNDFEALREVMITPIFSSHSGSNVGALVLFFPPVEARALGRAGMQRGIIIGERTFTNAPPGELAAAMGENSDASLEGRLITAAGTPWMAFSWQTNAGSTLPPSRTVCLYPVSEEQTRQQGQQLRIAGTGVMVLILGLLLSLLLSSRLAKPVQRLALDSEQNLVLRKEAESARERTERKYQSIFENAVEGLFVMDAAGKFLSVNPAAATLCGFSSPSVFLKGTAHSDFQLYVRPEDLSELLTAARTAGSATNKELEMIRYGGVLIWVSHNIRRVDGSDGTFHFEGSLEDVTERRRAARELQSLNSGLEKALTDLRATQQQVIQQERLRALGEMASGVAHDFNNALTPILGYSELLLNRGDSLPPEEKAEYLRTIHTAATDAGSVVSRLREFYRTTAGGETFHPVDLNGLARQIVTLTQPRWKDQARSRGVTVTVETDLAKELPPIAGDAPALREMLTNMIFNAVDAMPSGGTITLRTRHGSDRCFIEVQDTGTGMTDEVRRHCLEPFFSTKGEAGTGLGLSMCFGIVQRHSGDINIRSEISKGTTFIMSFPVTSQTAEIAAPVSTATTSPTAERRTLTILAVDDEHPIRLLLQAMLKNDGHQVTTAADGQEALTLFNGGGGNFDLVITDKSMPGMSGDQLAAAIKSASPGTPVILLTGFGQFLESSVPGVDVVASKPISVESLRAAIASTRAL